MADSTTIDSHFHRLEVSVPEFKKHKEATPVLADDIKSTACKLLKLLGIKENLNESTGVYRN